MITRRAPGGADRLELRGDDVVAPARREERARVELVEAVLCEARKIGAQQCGILARTMGLGRHHASRRAPCPEERPQAALLKGSAPQHEVGREEASSP